MNVAMYISYLLSVNSPESAQGVLCRNSPDALIEWCNNESQKSVGIIALPVPRSKSMGFLNGFFWFQCRK